MAQRSGAAVFLITGCGRSGTSYTAKVLRAAGMDVGHERKGIHGTVSSLWAVESERYPYFHAQKRPEFDVVLHQVREPLATIGSLTTALKSSWRWNAQHIELDMDWSALRIAAEYWLQWNALCEDQAVMTYRVECIRTAWPDIGWTCGVLAQFPAGVPENVNRRTHRAVTWKEIYEETPHAASIQKMALRYGYGG